MDSASFYSEYHGHKISDLRDLLYSLKDTKGEHSVIYLVGDSTLDNKFWFSDTAKAVNGYEKILAPPTSKKDIAYWVSILFCFVFNSYLTSPTIIDIVR